jgi:hypothetical protein
VYYSTQLRKQKRRKIQEVVIFGYYFVLHPYYYWWNCFDAQEEAKSNNVPIGPGVGAPWHEYGWTESLSPTKTKTITGSMLGAGDARHWAWTGAIVYLYCNHQLGIMQADLAFVRNPLQFTWSTFWPEGWTDPEVW